MSEHVFLTFRKHRHANLHPRQGLAAVLARHWMVLYESRRVHALEIPPFMTRNVPVCERAMSFLSVLRLADRKAG